MRLSFHDKDPMVEAVGNLRFIQAQPLYLQKYQYYQQGTR